MSEDTEALKSLINNIQKQYFQMRPIRNFEWKENLWNDVGSVDVVGNEIVKTTVNHPISRLLPPSLSYQKNFLKGVMKLVEDLGAEYAEDVYTKYADILLQEEESSRVHHKIYTLPDNMWLAIAEQSQCISEGTTGLQSWTAGKVVAQWAMENSELFKDKKVLELGCGIGLLGLTICLCAEPDEYCFTDCHSSVMKILYHNIKLNEQVWEVSERSKLSCGDSNLCQQMADVATLLQSKMPEISASSFNANNISCHFGKRKMWWKEIDWSTFDVATFKDSLPDIILATDVVYDEEVIDDLVKLLHSLLTQAKTFGKTSVAYVASTVRRQETLEYFHRQICSQSLFMEKLERKKPADNIFYFDCDEEVELLYLTCL